MEGLDVSRMVCCGQEKCLRYGPGVVGTALSAAAGARVSGRLGVLQVVHPFE